MTNGRSGLVEVALRTSVFIVALAIWEIVGLLLGSRSHIVPTPVAVIQELSHAWHVFASALSVTGREALWGFVIGNLVAIGLGFIASWNRVISAWVQQLGVISYCLPIVAIGPILIILLGGRVPEEVLAGIAVVFTTMVFTAEGLSSSPSSLRDLGSVCGASPWRVLMLIRIRLALPYLLRGLKIAAPAAFLGAIIGEFLGAGSGLGVVMVQSEQALQVTRTWAAAVLATVAAGAGYLVIGVAERVFVPWSREIPS